MRQSVCDTCDRPLPEPARTGRPRTYCSTRCRRVAEFARRREQRAEQRGAWIVKLRDELGPLYVGTIDELLLR